MAGFNDVPINQLPFIPGSGAIKPSAYMIVIQDGNVYQAAVEQLPVPEVAFESISVQPGGGNIVPSQAGVIFSNKGAIALTQFFLPTWAEAFSISFLVENANGIQIVARGTDTINNSGDVSTAGGSITSGTNSSGAGSLIGFSVTIIGGAVVGSWYVFPAALGLWTKA